MTSPEVHTGRSTAAGLRDVIDQVARWTEQYPYKVWGFGESIAMEALLAAGGAHATVAARLLEDWAHRPEALQREPLAHVVPGVPLLLLFDETGDPVLLRRAHELASILGTTLRGRHGARIHRPDLPGWEHEAWVDCMHLDAPFLTRLALVTDDSAWMDTGAALLLSHARVLQDQVSGLFFHGFDDQTGHANGVFWGRGQGWALLGLVDTALNLPDSHPARPEILHRLDALATGLSRTEADRGKWRTVVDNPQTYIETSVSAFAALGLDRALRARLLAPRYSELADRAWAATLSALTPAGELRGVSDATPVGLNWAHYDARPTGAFPWGQGPALLAALDREHDRHQEESVHA